MKRVAIFCIAFLSLTEFSYARIWRGTVVDADCKQHDHKKECAVSSGTTAFGLLTVGGKFVKFDEYGNSQLSQMLPARIKSGRTTIRAMVIGKAKDQTIRVKSIQIQ